LPETPFERRLIADNRLLRYDYTKVDAFSCIYLHPNLSGKYLEDFQYYCYKKEYEELGPSIFRVIDVKYQGYLSLLGYDSVIAKKRREDIKNFLIRSYPLLRMCIIHAKSQKIKEQMKGLRQNIQKEFDLNNFQNISQEMILLVFSLIKVILPKKIYYSPKMIKKVFH